MPPILYSFLACRVPFTEGGKEGKGCVHTFSLALACILVHLILRRGRDLYAQIRRLWPGEVRRRAWEHSSFWVCQGPMPGLSMQRYLKNAHWLNPCMHIRCHGDSSSPIPFLVLSLDRAGQRPLSLSLFFLHLESFLSIPSFCLLLLPT